MRIPVPELTEQLADEMTKVVINQLKTSRDFKRPRLAQIKESEDLYNGIMKVNVMREASEPFPFMSGFVDYLYSSIDEPPVIEFEQRDEADYNSAQIYQSIYAQEKDSPLPHAKWALKDRWGKKLAIFSGRAIHKFYTDNFNGFRANFETVDHYDFHCEPTGGGHLENHKFCGEEGIFLTKEELEVRAEEGYFDSLQVQDILSVSTPQDYKDIQNELGERNQRFAGGNLDPVTNNYVGQELYKIIEWYLTYKGVRWQVSIDERSRKWLRVKPLREVFEPLDELGGEALYPYLTWATHEDPKVFWSKAACDDARPIAKAINKLINQELYNREKKNKGTRLYDPEMIDDIEALVDERPDGLIPIDTKGGKRNLSQALYRVEHGDITGTLDLVSWIDNYHGQKSGASSSAMGQAETNKKVGVFFGELQQIEKRLSTFNRSYREMYEELGMRLILGAKKHLTNEYAVQLIGVKGMEWRDITNTDLSTKRPLKIKIKGGADESQKNEILTAKKSDALAKTSTVSPRWKDEELLRNSGYSPEDIKDAFSTLDTANKALMSEAAEAIEMIVSGKGTPELNRGANVAFMQKIIDAATDLTLENKKLEKEIALELYKYAEDHAKIVAENERRKAQEIVLQQNTNPGMANAANADAVQNTGIKNENVAINSAIPETTPTLSPLGPGEMIKGNPLF